MQLVLKFRLSRSFKCYTDLPAALKVTPTESMCRALQIEYLLVQLQLAYNPQEASVPALG